MDKSRQVGDKCGDLADTDKGRQVVDKAGHGKVPSKKSAEINEAMIYRFTHGGSSQS
jgi:hypothetical protein